MTPQDLAADLRSRINPAYSHQLGTESYERRLCAEAIEGLIAKLAEQRMIIFDHEMADYIGEAAMLKEQIEEQQHDNNRMFVELESLKLKLYASTPRTIGDIGTACGEYVECTGRPDAPHGVDLEASFRTGRTVCVCKSWAPGEAS